VDIPYKATLPQHPRPICIIGAGGIVNDAHLPAYRLAGFEVVSIADLNRERAENLAAKFGIAKAYTKIEEMIAAAPKNAVYDIAIMAAQFLETLEKLPDGSPVLIQKPMGNNLEMAKEILSCCRRKKLVAAINFQLRFAPFVAAARWLINEGYIGEIYDMEVRVCISTPWHLFPNVMKHPRLEILNHSIHYIDLLRSFLGNPATVLAKTLRHPAKDLSSTRSTILFDYGDTLHAVINVNHDHEFGAHQQESFIKWEGTKGAIKAKMGLLMNYPDGGPDKFEYCLLEPGEEPVWQEQKLDGSWFPDAFVGTMSNLMRFAEGSDATLQTSVEDAIDTMAIVEAAYQSSAKGGEPVPESIRGGVHPPPACKGEAPPSPLSSRA
jgi:predicted dehydrogenase